MNINRHNYEEYFILYMDNELSSDERRMVETFVQNHPDLKEELDILLQYKLVPDNNIVFEGKDELMKVKGESPVTLSNYEEWLVLYMDNELTADQRKTVEQFIAANPAIQKEADLLLRTQLQPEIIVFANKEVLYRREEKVRPILWWRAVAAVFILALGITSVIVFNKKGNAGKDEIAAAPGTEEKTIKENPVATNENSSNQEVKGENKETQIPIISNNVQNAVTTTLRPANTTTDKKNNIVPVKANGNIITPIKKNEEVMANNDKPTTNNLPLPSQNRNVINTDASNAIANVTIPKEINNSNTSLTNTGVTTKDPQSSDIRTASLTSNADDADFNQPNGKKSKLRGFFRKVTRTFEKRTNIDPTENDEKLLVGGLAIRLK
jgi:hypothetical protein